MVTHKMLHASKQHYGIRKDSLIIEVDMSKAYDRLEWNFLEEYLRAYDFNNLWVDRVIKCVREVTYHFKINGIPSQKLIHQRGLR